MINNAENTPFLVPNDGSATPTPTSSDDFCHISNLMLEKGCCGGFKFSYEWPIELEGRVSRQTELHS